MIQIPPISQNKIKQIRKLKNKKFRREEGIYVCEGYRIFQAAMHAQEDITAIILSQDLLQKKTVGKIVDYAEEKKISYYECDPHQFNSLSDEKSPAGILFLVRSEIFNADALSQNTEPALIYMENISEPGNLGTIIRSAVWFGLKSIILSPGCVDSTNPKVVRATAGAMFSCKVYQDTDFDRVLNLFRSQNYKFTAAAFDKSVSLKEWSPSGKDILIFGSEATGLSQEILEQCDQIVTIPGSGDIESLNLAVSAGIFFYKLTKT